MRSHFCYPMQPGGSRGLHSRSTEVCRHKVGSEKGDTYDRELLGVSPAKDSRRLWECVANERRFS